MKHSIKTIEDYVIAYNPTVKKIIVYDLGLDEQMDLRTHLWSSTGCVYDWWKKNETENLFTLFIYLLDLDFQYNEILNEYLKIKSFRNEIYKSVAKASHGLCP
jgi:hypothetical protein